MLAQKGKLWHRSASTPLYSVPAYSQRWSFRFRILWTIALPHILMSRHMHVILRALGGGFQAWGTVQARSDQGGDEDKRRDMIRVVEGNNYQRHYHIVHVHVRPRVGGVVLETSDEPLFCVVLGKRTTWCYSTGCTVKTHHVSHTMSPPNGLYIIAKGKGYLALSLHRVLDPFERFTIDVVSRLFSANGRSIAQWEKYFVVWNVNEGNIQTWEVWYMMTAKVD